MAKITPETRQKLHIVARAVRVAYPKVFEPEENTLSGKKEYSVQIRLYKDNPEHMKIVEKIRSAMKVAAKAYWGEDADRNYRNALDSKNTRWLRESDEGDYFFASLKRREQDGAPRVVGRDKTVTLRQEDGKVYSGAVMNVIFDIWCYSGTSKSGAKIPAGFSATLMGMQFVADGDPIGGASVAKDDDFDDLSTEEMTDDDFI